MTNDDILSKVNTVIEYANTVFELKPVEGYLHDLEGYALMRVAADGPGTGAIVEIGSFLGRSTCWLARGAKSTFREKVTAIDHFKGSPEHQAGSSFECRFLTEHGSTFPAFQENIRRAGVEDYVEPIVASSEDAAKTWDRPIRFLFIDGDHSYEATRRDFSLWAPFLIPGGCIAFHDVGVWDGVTQFVDGLLKASAEYVKLFSVAGLAMLQRNPPARDDVRTGPEGNKRLVAQAPE
ncbi:MAG: class I SAM-dependent methyltransferase [Candidatus Hydrogenedentes bacterium]|nr:class I SAM-dependent methyltransferase [Candidatus Hydrogenedentota bacterium]